jgi:hypothetical protein
MQVALALVLGSAWAGCGSDDVFDPQLASSERLAEKTAAATIAGDDQTMTRVIVVGDLDGDGVDDAIVQSAYTTATHDTGVGVYVLYGGNGVTGKFNVASLPTLTGAGGLAGGIAAVGDVDGDGLADFLIGIGRTPGCGDPSIPQNGPENSGAYLVYGSRTRVTGATPLAQLGVLLRDATPCTQADGVASLGDLDGDGKPDFAISRMQPTGGAAVAYLVYGRGTRLTGTLDLAATADATITTGMPFLEPLADVGDIDGDGHHDFVVSANDTGEPSGTIQYDTRLVRGSATRLTGTVALDTIAQTQFPSGQFCDSSGFGMGSRLGDLDGDGIDDFALASCPAATTKGYYQIVQHVFYGRHGGFPATVSVGDEDATITLTAGANGFSQIAGADLNGDGLPDLVVSDTEASSGNGAVHVIHGTGARLSGKVTPADHAISLVGETQRGTQCNNPPCSVAEMFGASFTIGALTGDHKPDLLVNAPAPEVAEVELGLHGSSLAHAYVVPASVTNP